ncbi:heparinase II/III family protein [Bacillus infantis]|uniref:heparinase II/III domain-containing protein n=1 Tax=Bacillus infantis TaxID=324767 RepID=UPI001CD7D7A0|nr:heparinase II/III family protein [Bacillus infantis]MCA1033607.1 heparinase II/III family protein [Bacillus infantis]
MDIDELLGEIRPHPRVLFNAEEIAAIKVRSSDSSATHIQFTEIWKEVLHLAERYAAETDFTVHYPSCNVTLTISLPLVQLEEVEQPPGYTGFPFWTMYSRAIEERIKVLSFAYAMTGKPLYAEKVKEYLLTLSSFSRWYEFPQRGAEGNLSNAHFTIGMAIGYDSIYSILLKEERESVEKAIVELGLMPLKIDFLNYDSHNIIASKRVAMLIGSLAVLSDDNKEAIAPFLKNAYRYLIRYLDDRLIEPDIEGLLYLNVAARHILMAADCLKRAAGREDLLQHPFFQFLPDIFLYMLGTGDKPGFVNFSDSFYSLDVFYVMSILASSTNHPAASWYIHRYPEKKLDILLDLKRIPAPQSPEEYYGSRLHKVFPGIGWASLRSGWGKDDYFLAFASSPSGKDHNHFDQNNFIFHSAGEWLITNPGYQDYVEGPRREFTLGTIGHNSMLADGQGQIHRGKGMLADWYTSEQFSLIAGEAAGAYDERISEWKRKIFYIDNRYYVLVDKVIKSRPDINLSFLYHTTGNILAGGQQILDGMYINEKCITFLGDRSSVRLYTCYPDELNIGVKKYPGAEEYGTYLEVTAAGEEEPYFITLIDPSKSNKTLVCQEDSGKIVLRVEDNESGIIDCLVLGAGEGKREAEMLGGSSIIFKAEDAWASVGQKTNELSALSLVNGTEISINGRLLLSSPTAVCAAIIINEQRVTVELELEGENEIYLALSPAKGLFINGHSAEQRMFTSELEGIKLSLPKGNHKIEAFLSCRLEN